MMSLRTHNAARAARGYITSLFMTATIGLVTCTSAFATEGHILHNSTSRDRGGVVYAMNNSAENNQIFVYRRHRDGKLHPVPGATVSTGGIGGSTNAAVDPLGSQNALLFDRHLNMLFAVNAGDNTVAAFRVAPGGVALRETALVPSGGFIPVSIAVSEHRLYVLNAGGSGSVATFEIGAQGALSQLATLDLGQSHEQTLPFDNVMAPGQVGVDALHRRIIVTNGGGRQLLSAALDDEGVAAGTLTATPTPGDVPFAFGVSRYGNILVAEAASGSVSSFAPSATGRPLVLTTASVATGQAATCWIVVTDSGYAYVANTGSDTISLYAHSRTGALTLLNAVAAEAAGAPTDMALAGHGKYLYTLDAGSGNISGFAIDPDSGALQAVETQTGLPASAGIQGIAAYDY